MTTSTPGAKAADLPGDVIPGGGFIVLRTGFKAGLEFHYE